VAGSGHVDIVGVLLLLVSAAPFLRRWRPVAAAGIWAAVSVKFLPIVLLPLYWRRVRMRDGHAGGNRGRTPITHHFSTTADSDRSLGTYVQRFRFNDPVFATLERVAAPQLVAGCSARRFLTAIWDEKKVRGRGPAEAFAWPWRIAFLRAGCLSVVPAMDAAVPKVRPQHFPSWSGL